AGEVRDLVPDAVPPLGHDGRSARLCRCGEADHAVGPLRGGDEGDRLRPRRAEHGPGEAVRRRRLRSGEARGIRARVCHRQREGIEGRVGMELETEAPGLLQRIRKRIRWDALLLPLVGIGVVFVLWAIISSTFSKNLPSPLKTWQVSQPYIASPFEKRGELDQGILRFTWYSLVLVAKGYLLAILIGTPLGFWLGLSKLFTKAFDPIIQILRPVSPLAWLPLGLILFEKSHPAAVFTIAICAMWPTVLNTALGVRAIPQ